MNTIVEHIADFLKGIRTIWSINFSGYPILLRIRVVNLEKQNTGFTMYYTIAFMLLPPGVMLSVIVMLKKLF
jgi:hypothetical protein